MNQITGTASPCPFTYSPRTCSQRSILTRSTLTLLRQSYRNFMVSLRVSFSTVNAFYIPLTGSTNSCTVYVDYLLKFILIGKATSPSKESGFIKWGLSGLDHQGKAEASIGVLQTLSGNSCTARGDRVSSDSALKSRRLTHTFFALLRLCR
jgi:hypothetical protein